MLAPYRVLELELVRIDVIFFVECAGQRSQVIRFSVMLMLFLISQCIRVINSATTEFGCECLLAHEAQHFAARDGLTG